MEAAESLSTAEWTLLTDVLLLGPAEPAQQPQEKKEKWSRLGAAVSQKDFVKAFNTY